MYRVVFVILLALILVACNSSGPPSRITLCAKAEVAVKNHLISPRSAHFQPCDQIQIQRTDFVDKNRHEYQISGWVDADNAFSASLRQSFSIDLMQDGTSWTVRSVDVH